jgi:SET domain-containing protein
MRLPNGKELSLLEVRCSPIHGTGVFAVRRIAPGTRVIEYSGERVSHAEADRRYEGRDIDDNHTFLFIVDSRVVIDAGVGGNAARFINHSCEPNCESVIESRRVFIEALKTIEPGEELTYDYLIQREDDDPPNVEQIFACRCGARSCRGTMLAPPKRPRRRRSDEDRPLTARARGSGP